ncbi:MAG: hypothetical protein LLF89_02730 [Spirochaetaceae bacterium]|nr:hypothetical protein [Spirochaetaceae bacterium]
MARSEFSVGEALLPILAAFIGCAGVSCSMARPVSVHSLQVSIPILPECWQGLSLDGYEVHWEDPAGQKRTSIMKPDEGLVVEVKRGCKQAILAYPLTAKARFRPFGALYPYDVAPETPGFISAQPDLLLFSSSSGYTAACAVALEKAGCDPWAFALDELHEVWEKKDCDPWQLATAEAASALMDASFGSGIFSAKATEVELPGEEAWWPESPFIQVGQVAGRKYACLPEGLNLLYGTDETLLVMVAGDETTMQRHSYAGTRCCLDCQTAAHSGGLQPAGGL